MNANDFQLRCLSYMKSVGRGYIITGKPRPEDKRANDAAADAWFCYLNRMGLSELAKTWRYILDGCSRSITVPCEKPELFDPGYEAPLRPPPWRGVQNARDVSPIIRKASVEAVMNKWRPKPGPTPKHMNRADEPSKELSPLALSPPLRENLGLAPLPVDYLSSHASDPWPEPVEQRNGEAA